MIAQDGLDLRLHRLYAHGQFEIRFEKPVRTPSDVHALRVDMAGDLNYVAESVRLVAQHFGSKLPVIGFCGAPYTLASYMIEGGGSRHYIETKKMMYRFPQVWDELMEKLVRVLAEYSIEQIRAGADVVQVFDSWVGSLSVDDYRQHVLPHTRSLIQGLRQAGAPVIYFGTDSATLLTSMQETGADVIGLDWRIPLDEGWKLLRYRCAVQGNMDPVLLFAEEQLVRERAQKILQQANGRPGHIFNLGHGILPETPVANVKALVEEVHAFSAARSTVKL